MLHMDSSILERVLFMSLIIISSYLPAWSSGQGEICGVLIYNFQYDLFLCQDRI